MAHLDDAPIHDPPEGRPRYRTPIGMPLRNEHWERGAIVSVLVHAVIIGLLIIPFFLPSSVIRRIQQGAGGAGPAGGGGGGRRGTGGAVAEKIIFVKGDPKVKYGQVVHAMDVSRGSGVKVIGVPPKDTPGGAAK